MLIVISNKLWRKMSVSKITTNKRSALEEPDDFVQIHKKQRLEDANRTSNMAYGNLPSLDIATHPSQDPQGSKVWETREVEQVNPTTEVHNRRQPPDQFVHLLIQV